MNFIVSHSSQEQIPSVYIVTMKLVTFLTFVWLLGVNAAGSRQFRPSRHESDKVEGGLAQGPLLLFTKNFSNNVFALGDWDIEVTYQIFNVGGRPAKNVLVSDPDFLDSNFIVRGESEKQLKRGEFTIPSISPGENLTFFLVARVNESSFEEFDGDFQFGPAKIVYGVKEELQIGWSSLSHDKVRFLSKAEAGKRFGSKEMDYLALGLMMFVCVCGPYALLRRHRRKYDALQSEANALKIWRKYNKKAKVLQINRQYRTFI